MLAPLITQAVHTLVAASCACYSAPSRKLCSGVKCFLAHTDGVRCHQLAGAQPGVKCVNLRLKFFGCFDLQAIVGVAASMVASPEPALDHAISPPRRRTRSAAWAKAAQKHEPEQPHLPQQQQQQKQQGTKDALGALPQQIAPGKRSKAAAAKSKAVTGAPADAEETGAEAADGEQAATDAHVLELAYKDKDQPRPYKQAKKVC